MKIWVTGANGMVGRALVSAVGHLRPKATLLAPRRKELDLTDRSEVRAWFDANHPDVVIHAAAKVGGIQANMADPVGFLSENASINLNVIEESRQAGVQRLLYLGSSCMYPKDFAETLVEENILQAPLEPTNEGYAIAKILGAKQCEYASRQFGLAYRTLIPCNLYGVNDHFDPASSHLVAATIRKVHEATLDGHRPVEIWGDGSARREFLYVQDLADFCVEVLDRLDLLPQTLNIGYGTDHSVLDYYQATAKILGYEGKFVFDASRPVGMKRKLMDSSRAASHGWKPRTTLEEGLRLTYGYFLSTLS